VTKGAVTRETVLEQAVEMANRVGIGGLTIGSLAERVEMSKSGIFAHFKSKEALQQQVLAYARERFVDQVVRPALGASRGEPRVRELFDRWLVCERDGASGCLFVSAASEYDDQPGSIRDRLAADHRDLMDAIAQIVRTGVAEGHFRADTDAEQFAHDMHGAMLAFFYAHRLLRLAEAESRTRRAFDALLAAVRA
jgi:AcrR family transcriptional regulator